MINTRSKWRAVARDAAFAASSCLPSGDFVIWGSVDWLGDAGVVLWANPAMEARNITAKTATAAFLRKNTAIANVGLICPFCNTMPPLPGLDRPGEDRP